MLVLERGQRPVAIPVFGTDQVADVTGAGDTVAAAFTAALAAGTDFVQAAHLANVAGGVGVAKRGTATVSAAELRRALNDRRFSRS
jgi:bifunctional ADP-heptose synthase (sugar kinase/adenylyltransferase)